MARYPIIKIIKKEDIDYSDLYILRFFFQKINDPENSIIEVSEEEYNMLGKDDGPSKLIWRKYSLPWAVKGDKEYIKSINGNTLKFSETFFKGISNYLKNLYDLCN